MKIKHVTENFISATAAQERRVHIRVTVSLDYRAINPPRATAGDISVHLTQSQRQ